MNAQRAKQGQERSGIDMTFTLKALQKHSPVVTALLDGTDCDFAFTGSVAEFEGVETHNWFISRPVSNDEIGIEDSLENLSIPYLSLIHI